MHPQLLLVLRAVCASRTILCVSALSHSSDGGSDGRGVTSMLLYFCSRPAAATILMVSTTRRGGGQGRGLVGSLDLAQSDADRLMLQRAAHEMDAWWLSGFLCSTVGL